MNATRTMSARAAYVLAASAAILLGIAAVARHPQRNDPAARLTLASDFQAAVNAGNAIGAAGLTGAGVSNRYQWVSEWKAGGNPHRWTTGLFEAGDGSDRLLLHVSRPQVCQSTFDHLYEIVPSPHGPRIGREIPETEMMGVRVTDHRLTVVLDVERRRATFTDEATLTRIADGWPVAIVRLNDGHRVSAAEVNGKPIRYRQAGGFVVIPKPAEARSVLCLRYAAALPPDGESFMTDGEAALTAYWYAHTARMPVTSDITVTTPTAWRSIAPGTLVSDTTDASRRTTRWRNTLPVCYLTVAAGRYTETTREADGVRLSAWLRRPSVERAASTLDEAARAIRTFGTAFAAFPYDHYTVVESLVFPPALEAYSFTLVGAPNLPGVVAHEVAHTWWGGLVPNTYTRSMWNEAFATYSDGLYRRRERNDGSEPGAGARDSGAAFSHAVTLASATDAMHPAHAAVGYGTGAQVLEQLERMVGTRPMIGALKRFAGDHKRGEAAEWSDFAAALMGTCGPEWRGALDGWLRLDRLPQYRLRAVQAVAAPDGFQTTGTVVPDPPGVWSLAPLQVRTPGAPAEQMVLIKGEPTRFRIHSRLRPRSIAVDPDGFMLRDAAPVVVDTPVR
jgi:hypothetical protein